MSRTLFAGVHILDAPYAIDKSYSYAVPEQWQDTLRPGDFVTVPFGRSGAQGRPGLVTELSDTCEYATPKAIADRYPDEFTLSDELLRLCFFMKETTLCSVGEAARTLMPSVVLDGTVREEIVYRYTLTPGTLQEKIRGDKQKAVLEALDRLGGSALIEELDLECGFHAAPQLRTLCDAGRITAAVVEKQPEETPVGNSRTYVLNDEQKNAFDTLCQLADTDEPHAALLFGVTGSGKTCVMVKVIERMLAMGRDAIVLLPEIALTPQSVAIFTAAFGDTVAVIHSGLSPAGRRDAFRRIKKGEAHVVVGTRSAVFAPVQNLGTIIIDEEQEHTYKSDANPKYHARDIARFRCANNNALMLLCSATPSIESYQKAKEGTYTLLKLTKRYGGAVLPRVEIADVRHEAQEGNLSPIGARLTQLLQENRKAGEQSILFLNRRGYHHYLYCPKCGDPLRCPACSVTLTYHTNRGTYENGRMVCHVCGRNMPVPKACPSCGGETLLRMGYGTQRVEQELQELLPHSTVLRMDTDSTAARDACEEILGKFRRREANLLLGTQMVTKGHDFPGVTLVGVLSADASLYLDDFRAAERTFAMLTQVIGRAGRGSDPGVALIQTNNPDNDVIRLACAQDYDTFFNREIVLRRTLQFPPFCDIVLLTMSDTSEKNVLREIDALFRRLRDDTSKGGRYEDVALQVFGPFEAPVYRVENRYRMRLVVKCRLNKRSRAMFGEYLCGGPAGQKPMGLRCALSVDLNPTTL